MVSVDATNTAILFLALKDMILNGKEKAEFSLPIQPVDVRTRNPVPWLQADSRLKMSLNLSQPVELVESDIELAKKRLNSFLRLNREIKTPNSADGAEENLKNFTPPGKFYRLVIFKQ